MIKSMRLAALVVAVTVWFSPLARADQIALTSGLLDLTGTQPHGHVQLVGDRGFTFNGFMYGFFGLGDPVVPGTSFALDGVAIGMDLPGTATLDGITYAHVGSGNAPSAASIRLVTADAIVPPVLSPTTEITTPFVLDLVFLTGEEGHTLSGSGLATIFLETDRFEVPSWQVNGVRAELSSDPAASVPEPASLSLLALGLAGMGVRRWRQRTAP
jgi:PEP-CTERM motif